MLYWRYCLLLLALCQRHVLAIEDAAQPNAELAATARAKRGTVTIDFGVLLRNVLLKSAQFSNAKADITRAIAAAKTTRRPPMMLKTMTTTAAPAPPPPPPPPLPPLRRRRPPYGGVWRPYDYYNAGYIPFDYDYGEAPAAAPATTPATTPAPTPAPTPTPTPAPAPAATLRRVRPLPPRYVYDFDYDYDAAAPPAKRARLRAQPQLQPRRPQHLGDSLVYQYAQTTDTYSNPGWLGNGGGGGAAVTATAAALTARSDTNAGENNDDVNIDADTGAAATGAGADAAENPQQPFLVNYASEDADDGYATASGQQQLKYY